MSLQQSSATAIEHYGVRKEAEKPLRGVWLFLARITWVAVSLLAVGLFVASLPPYFAYLHILAKSSFFAPQLTPDDILVLHQLGLSLDFYAWLNMSVSIIIFLVYVLVGVLLFIRKSEDPLALLASISLVLFPFAFSTQVVGTLPAAWALPVEIVEFLGNISLGLFFFVFPNGRFVPRWSILLMGVWIIYWTISNFFPDSALANAWPLYFILPGVTISLIILQVYRYRRVSTPTQRQQTKWVIAGFAIAFGPLVISNTIEFTLLIQFFPKSSLLITLFQIIFNLLLVVFPLSLGFAILRYRLWDIDRLVNRTLVYGTLTISLALIYAVLVFGFQFLFGQLIKQSNGIVIVASTLVIAALFQPLRSRIQNIIDHRFYRRKYDSARTLEAFSATLRNEVDLATLSKHLVAVVEETMQPAHVSLWLRPPNQEQMPWSATSSVSSESDFGDEK
ncbi:MAG TPA: hypothetical protein VEI53_09775 [Ktedonobacteraceae bacterium]|nr:hypothetical protein [Ktedonobacteraceae bacterium]